MSPFAKAGFDINHNVYKNAVGAIELVCAILMLLGGVGILSKLGNSILIIVMCGAVYTHIAVGHPWEELVPAVSLGSLLAIRLILLTFSSGDQEGKKRD